MGQTGHFMRKFDFYDSATLVTLESYGRVHVLNLLNLVLICVHQRRVGRRRVWPGGGVKGLRRLLSGVPLDCAPVECDLIVCGLHGCCGFRTNC